MFAECESRNILPSVLRIFRLFALAFSDGLLLAVVCGLVVPRLGGSTVAPEVRILGPQVRQDLTESRRG